MPIIHMTPGSISFQLGEKVAKVGGELLMPEGDLQNYVVYAKSLRRWNPPHEQIQMTVADKRLILEGIKSEIPPNKVHLEIDDLDEVLGGTSIDNPRVMAGEACPQSGFWFTPARLASRRYFFQGEVLPTQGGDYGTTIWQWDVDQATPDKSFMLA